MRFRKMRIAWSVLVAIACVLLILLWVRSYRWHDGAFGHSASSRVYLFTWRGKIWADGRILPSRPSRPPRPWVLVSTRSKVILRAIQTRELSDTGAQFDSVPQYPVISTSARQWGVSTPYLF